MPGRDKKWFKFPNQKIVKYCKLVYGVKAYYSRESETPHDQIDKEVPNSYYDCLILTKTEIPEDNLDSTIDPTNISKVFAPEPPFQTEEGSGILQLVQL